MEEENEEYGEDEGLKEIQEHEDCIDFEEQEINEQEEARADLTRKYDYEDLTGERQENFNN